MEIVDRPLASLKFDPRNARKHGEKNLEAIKASLARFGQQKPIVVTPDGTVIAGNGTLAAAMALGWESVKAVTTTLAGSDLSAFGIADNRTGELAEWDDANLDALLADIAKDDRSLAIATGFDDADISARLAKLAKDIEPEKKEPEETEGPPFPTEIPARVALGDIWTLGQHRLICGDSGAPEIISALLGAAASS